MLITNLPQLLHLDRCACTTVLNFYIQNKSRPLGRFLCFCKMSRILSRRTTVAIMYLGCVLPHTSSDSFVKSNWFPTNTILHVGRILAVAPDMFPYRFTLAGALSSRIERHCSHPWDYPGGCYPLPSSIYIAIHGRVRTFLWRLRTSDCLLQKSDYPTRRKICKFRVRMPPCITHLHMTWR